MNPFKIHTSQDKNTDTLKILSDRKTGKILTALLHETDPMTEHFKDVRDKFIELIEKKMR